VSFSIAKTPSLKGKTALVTGGNIGLGFETVKALASKGAHVLLAARNEEKGKVAVLEIQKLVPKLGSCLSAQYQSRSHRSW